MTATPLRASILEALKGWRTTGAYTYVIRNILGRKTGPTTAQIRRELRRMEKDGLVATAPTTNQRDIMWRLTDKGRGGQ